MYRDVFGKEHRYGPPRGWVQPTHESLGPQDWEALVATGLHFPLYRGPVSAIRNPRRLSKPALGGWAAPGTGARHGVR